jgi:hypothetical protein
MNSDVDEGTEGRLKRWTVFMRFLDDGRICLSNNAAERGVRGIALGRKSWYSAAPMAVASEPRSCTA